MYFIGSYYRGLGVQLPNGDGNFRRIGTRVSLYHKNDP